MRASGVRTFAVILLLGAAVRLTLLFGFHRYEIGRPEPIRIALSLAAHGAFADPYALPTGPTAHTGPFYPALIAPLYSLFGDTLTADLARFALNALAASAEYALLPLIAAALGMGVMPGVVAGVAGALIPLHYWPECMGDFEATWIALFLELATLRFASYLGSSGLSPGAGAWGVGRPAKVQENGSKFGAAGLRLRFSLAARTPLREGMFWGVGFLIAPNVLPVGIAFAAVAAWKMRPAAGAVARWLAVFAAGALLVLSPWLVRNYIRLGGVFFVRDNIGLELFVSNHDHASAESTGNFQSAFFVAAHPHASVEAAREIQRIGEWNFERRKLAQAVAWIRGNPREFFVLTASRVRAFWFPSLPRFQWVVWSATLAGLAGFAWMCRRSRHAAVVLGAVLAAYPAIYYLLQNTLRYQHPVWWALVLAGGWAAHEFALRPIWQRRKQIESSRQYPGATAR